MPTTKAIMLYTRCPECETTFRITESALQQADGQVRCGRCSHIFDAHDSLTDRLPDPDDPDDPAPATALTDGQPATGKPPAGAGDETGPGDAADADPSPQAAGPDTARPIRDTGAPARPQAASPPVEPAGPRAAGADSVPAAATSLAAELELAEAEANDDDGEAQQDERAGHDVMSADQIDAVLATAAPAATAHWLDEEEPAAEDPRRARLWRIGAIAAVALLGLQLVHHFRSTLAGAAGIGPVVQGVYAVLGQRVLPDWDVTGYELLDWTAVEAPGQQTERNLLIRSRLRNAADRAQPYPMIQLTLLNRWEDAVGARLFEPDEYSRSNSPDELMTAGATIETELVIVDPGTDAYGFELAVCLETATGVVCDTDATFR